MAWVAMTAGIGFWAGVLDLPSGRWNAAMQYYYVSLDKVIKTMMATGRNMKARYEKISRGGLTVNVVEC
jgi:hypothetical protein